MLFTELPLKAVWRFFEIESDFVYGVRCRSRHSVSKGPLVETHSVIKAKCKHFANNHFVCFSSQNLPYGGASDFVLRGSSPYNPKNNKKSKVDKSTLDFLVRWKGLEPPTYWFVAAWICIKYAENGCFKPFLLYKICPQVYLDLYN